MKKLDICGKLFNLIFGLGILSMVMELGFNSDLLDSIRLLRIMGVFILV